MATAPKTGTDTVTVGSKLPNGLVLRLYDETTVHEPVMGGGTRAVKAYRANGREFTINGTGVMWGQQRPFQMAWGAALTPGVPRDLWERWCDQNKGCAVLENGLVFAATKSADVVAKAKDSKGQKTGLEPLDPTQPMKVGRGATAMQVVAADSSTKPDMDVLEDVLGAG
jgi:hypothetical protein